MKSEKIEISNNSDAALAATACTLNRREKRKAVKRARNRLLSIRQDSQKLTSLLDLLRQQKQQQLPPVLANERCGSWYINTTTTSIHDTCYFKSTDGHKNIWNFSLKRLNLNVIRIVAKAACSCCILVDASATKEIPDSFARTLPIWVCVINRITARYRKELVGVVSTTDDDWDTALYTPSSCVGEEEHAAMENVIEDRVWAVYTSKAIVDPQWLVQTLRKPLRPVWIVGHHSTAANALKIQQAMDKEYYSIICVSCSDIYTPTEAFLYSPGAADDQESWGRGLTPALFWDNTESLLEEAVNAEETEVAIDRLVTASPPALLDQRVYDQVGELNLSIGSRRAGRPPECWDSFDAIVNVTEECYFGESNVLPNNKYYLQLPVREGKRDKIELERWMAVGIVFIAVHAHEGRRILIHCAQGKDRSAALAMAAVLVLCKELTLPMRWRCSLLAGVYERFGTPSDDGGALYRYSGLAMSVVESLLGQNGRDCLLTYVRGELGADAIPINKDSTRLALLLMQQDREKVDPSRSTMQKLNRFFMSEIMFTP